MNKPIDNVSPDYDNLWRDRWGIVMLEVADRGLNMTFDHETYPRWTCRLWRDVGSYHVDVTAYAYAPLDCIIVALEKVRELD